MSIIILQKRDDFMNKLFDKQKKYIWKYFKDISEIPRGSGNTELISEYLVRFAKKRDLR